MEPVPGRPGASDMKQEIQFCSSSDGTRIAFAKAGQGPPLVRVGSWFTHIEVDWESAVWGPWFSALARGRTLLRYDPRGSGLSDRNVDDLSLEAWVGDLEAVVEAAALERFSMIGLCHGGAVAIAYAARHPDRVNRLVLYDSYLQGGYAEGVNDELARQTDALGRMIEVGWGRNAGAFRELFANLLMPEAGQQELRWIGELQHLSASAPDACRLWSAFNAFDVRAEAARVTVPTLVFHVRGDAMVPFEAGRRLASFITGARFVPLEGRNHILMANEKAWNTFRTELDAFLALDEPIDAESVDGLPDLTSRERQVLDHLARGLSNTQIADCLSISEKTVRNHVSNVFSKLDVHHRSQAIVMGRKAGLGRD